MKTGEGLARSSGREGIRRRRRTRSRLLEILVGVGALAVALLVLGGSLLRTGSPTQQQEVTRAIVPLPVETPSGGGGAAVPLAAPAEPGEKKRGDEAKAAGLSKDTDRKALAYFVGHKATKRLKDIRRVGGYLRIYTDLPESATNSKQALKLCETGRDYLVGELGEPRPVVFVQAKFGENGNPVLANILGPDDSDCRLTYPEPK